MIVLTISFLISSRALYSIFVQSVMIIAVLFEIIFIFSGFVWSKVWGAKPLDLDSKNLNMFFFSSFFHRKDYVAYINI